MESNLKINEMKQEFLNRLQEHSILRSVLPLENVSSNNTDTKFVKIGVNNLINSNFFNNTDKNVYYDSKEVGRIYGTDIANAENDFLINEIISETNIKPDLVAHLPFTNENILSCIESLDRAGNKPDFILISPRNMHILWKLKAFIPSNRANYPKDYFLEGSIYDCKVISLFSVPENALIFLHSKQFARILIKKDIKAAKDIEISEKVLSSEINNSGLKEIDLTDKTRVHAYEIIGLKIDDWNSARIIMNSIDPISSQNP